MSEDIAFTVSPVPGGVRIDEVSSDCEDLVIPEIIDGKPVLEIGEHAVFAGCPMVQSITVPGTVKVLHPYAFALCLQLERLILNEGLEAMEASSITATSIRSLILPASLRRLGRPEEMDCRILVHPDNPWFVSDGYGLYEQTSEGKRLLAVDPRSARTAYALQDGCTEIAKSAFLGVERQEGSREWLSELSLPESVREIPEGAFSIGRSLKGGLGVRKVTVDPRNPVYVMEDDLLCRRLSDEGYELVRCFSEEETLTLPKAVQVLDAECFNHCPVKTLICGSVPEIHENSFLGCSLEKFQVPEWGITIRFPLGTDFAGGELLQGFANNGHLYDFTAYDKLLTGSFLNAGRVRMMTGRLLYPLELSETVREKLIERIKKEALSIMTLLLDAGDMGTLRELLSLHLLEHDGLTKGFEEADRRQMGEAKLLFMNALRQISIDMDEFDL